MTRSMLARRGFLRAGLAATGALAAGLPALRTGTAAEPGSIGVLIPGSITDKGFMESAHQGFKKLQSDLGAKAQLQLIENINYADMEQAVTTLAQKNAFVAAVSGASQAAMTKVSKRFTDVKFALVGGAIINEATNMSQFDMRQAEISFVAGATAALFSKSNVISYICGLEIPGVVNASKEFANGAKHVKPDIKTIVLFTGNFDDVAKAKEAALATISQGADVHGHVLNRGLAGLEQAAREKSTQLIGGILPQCGVDKLYAAYSLTGVGYMLETAVKSHLDGSWKPGSKAFGLKAGPQASDLLICDATMTAAKAKVEEIKQAIVSGQITTLPG